MVQILKSRGLTIVIVEHSAKPLVLSYSAVRRDRLHWNNERVVEPLMVTLQMIMRHKLSNRVPQCVFTKEVAGRLVRDAGFDPVIVGKLIRGKAFEPDTRPYNSGVTGPELRNILL